MMRKHTDKTAEEILADLCALCRVDMDGLARYAAPGDPKRQEDLKSGENLQTFINVLFNADSSVADVVGLILLAAREPEWRVHLYFHDEDGIKRHADSYSLRAPTREYAENFIIDKYRDVRAETWSADANQLNRDASNEHKDDDGSCRLVNDPL